jgi:hypothetical protein
MRTVDHSTSISPGSLWEIRSPVQTQRMDSETQWKWDFNGARVPEEQSCWKQLQLALYCLVCKSLPRSPIGPVLGGVHSFPGCHLDFRLGYLKYASLGIGQILQVGFRWQEGLLVTRAFWHIRSFYPFLILWWFTPPSLSSLISWPSPNLCKLINQPSARVKCLASKMDHHWLYF